MMIKSKKMLLFLTLLAASPAARRLWRQCRTRSRSRTDI